MVNQTVNQKLNQAGNQSVGSGLLGSGIVKKGKGSGEREVELPPGFPATDEAAKATCNAIGCPDDFVVKVWNRALSRGGIDSNGVPIRSFKHHVAASWAYERDHQKRQASNKSQTPARVEKWTDAL